MAAQPPPGWGQPPQHVPDEHKPLLQSRGFWLTVIGVVLAAALALATNALVGGGDDGGDDSGGTGGNAPSSANASAQITQSPSAANGHTMRLARSGWHGDSAVTVIFPNGSIDGLVHDGSFEVTAPVQCNSGGSDLTVQGKQSGVEAHVILVSAIC
jgi:hypothetical protein